VNDNFVNLPTILSRLNVMAVDGILLDLGLSLDQLKYSGRGFGFGKDEPLDMRMDTTSVTKAEDLINTLEEEKLATIFREYGEERWARHIARSIGAARKLEPIKSSKRLAELVCQAVPAKASFQQRIHPATRTFMSLRIAVNRELERLDAFMKNVATFLNPKGRLCVVSFHSLEDRIVKQNIRELEGQCLCPPDFPKCICNKKKKVRSLTKKVLRPQQEEIAINPMSRSAKLRVAEKI
jgi:16S rRNA (cytosine1402-N4)-methyltransferase